MRNIPEAVPRRFENEEGLKMRREAGCSAWMNMADCGDGKNRKKPLTVVALACYNSARNAGSEEKRRGLFLR